MKGMFGAIAGLLGIIAAIPMFWAGLLFEHRPAGWPNIHLNLGPIHWTLKLPDGPFAQLDALRAAQRLAQARTIEVARSQAQITQRVQGEAVRAQVQIRTVYRNIIHEVPAHVTPAIDRAFPLPVGLLRVHDSAALGVPTAQVPDPAGRADEAPGDVTASQFGAVVAENYGVCRADQDRQRRLQAWLEEMTLAAVGLGEEATP